MSWSIDLSWHTTIFLFVYLFKALTEYLKQGETGTGGNSKREVTTERDKPSNENISALSDFLNQSDAPNTSPANQSPAISASTNSAPLGGSGSPSLYRKGPRPYMPPGGVTSKNSPSATNSSPDRVPGQFQISSFKNVLLSIVFTILALNLYI